MREASRSAVHSLAVALRGAGTLLATLSALLLVTFTLSTLSPVDPALQRVGSHASRSAYLEMRRALGLDDPWPVRFGHYVVGLARGDLGVSQSTGQPVVEDLERVVPLTIELATVSMAVSALFGLGLAAFAAWRPRSALDLIVRMVSVFGSSVPTFWLGLLALFAFYARLHWAGGPGRLDDAYEYTLDLPTGFVLFDTWRSHVPGAFVNALAHLVLPVLILAAYAIGNITRITRSALLDEAGKEYVTLARAKGAGELRVLLRHMLPNAMPVVVTTLALTYASLLEGAVLVETVFARPGLGRYLTTALFAGDSQAVLGGTLVIGLCFVLINGLADLLVQWLDPRSR